VTGSIKDDQWVVAPSGGIHATNEEAARLSDEALEAFDRLLHQSFSKTSLWRKGRGRSDIPPLI